MASIDKRPLKAFVRFDGTGRIVPSSLILRRKKPKVGKWVEIPAYECCNPTTTTTTTALPCLKYRIVVPDGGAGGILGVNCDNEVVDVNDLVGPLTTTLCAKALEGTGDTILTIVNNCDTPCITYQIVVPSGGNATISGVDCDGISFSGTPLTGPINAAYCFRSVTGVGDISISLTGPCDTP